MKDFNEFEVTMESRFPLQESDPNDFVIDYKMSLWQYSKRADGIHAGYLRAFVVRCEDAEEAGEDLFSVFDAHSQELSECYSALYGDDTNPWVLSMFDISWVDNLLYVDLCVIAPQFRGRKLGRQLLYKACQTIGSGCTVVACNPGVPRKQTAEYDAPLDWLENNPWTLTGLRKHWEQMGFRGVPRHEIFAALTAELHP